MLEDVARWAFTSAFGISLTSGILVAIIIAIAARASAGFRAGLAAVWRAARRLRITTDARPSKLPLAPARWILRPSSDRQKWILGNVGDGRARAVQIDPADGDSMVVGAGFWNTIPGHSAVGVSLVPAGSGLDGESFFRVVWHDDRKTQWGVNVAAFPRDTFEGNDKFPPIPPGTVVSIAE